MGEKTNITKPVDCEQAAVEPGGRGRRIEVRVSDRELSRIKSRARRHCMTVSAYVRDAALRADGAHMVEVDVSLLREVHANLKRAGSNVNQIARQLNTYGPESVHSEMVRMALASISVAADAASTVLVKARGKIPHVERG